MDIDAADKLRLQAIAPWVRRANREIARRVADAAAHAERPSTRANPGRHLITPIERLADLRECLVGSGETNIRGIIPDARAAFYRMAFRQTMPDAIRDASALPTRYGETQARTVSLFGLSLFAEIQPVFLSAINGLKTTLHMIQTQDMNSQQRSDAMDTWETMTRNKIQQAVMGMLSDAEVAIMNLVGRQMIRPEFRAIET